MSVEYGSNITPLFGDREPPEPPAAGRPRVKKRRLLAIFLPLSILAVVSTLFGMMMAVASDLPDLENRKEYQDARNSILVDSQNQPLGVLTNNQSRVLVRYQDLSSYMTNAIIAIEDRRFYENSGIDVRGIGRALVQDVLSRKAAQGGSTIAQQFVKNALRAQSDRTVFQKMREAALAYRPHAQVAQEQDPHGVPELDLLRQRRLRRRIGRAHLLRQPARPQGLRHARRPVRQGAQARRGRADRRRRGQPHGL